MAFPWLQIVQLVPSLVDVSRELLKKTHRQPLPGIDPESQTNVALAARLASLEENERRQAALISQLAEQITKLISAVTALHRRAVWLGYAVVLATAVAITAVIVAIAT